MAQEGLRWRLGCALKDGCMNQVKRRVGSDGGTLWGRQAMRQYQSRYPGVNATKEQVRRAEKETDATMKNFKTSYATGKRKIIRLSIMKMP